jgi:isopentenyl phosphate kinase
VSNSGPLIVKLGGSVITWKRGRARVRAKIVERIARELSTLDNQRLIVLHGAGSFGHPGAVRWGLAKAPTERDEEHRRRGAAIVSAEVRKLHVSMLNALIDQGIPAFSVPPSIIARNRLGELAWMEERPFREALAGQAVPLSFGDVVRDEVWGYSILSADTIALQLARALSATRVIFVSDIEGVYEKFDGGRGRIVPNITPSLLSVLQPSPGVPDVTGGIRGKVEAMLAIAESGADAGLISGLKDGAVARALRGETVYGSWARARQI